MTARAPIERFMEKIEVAPNGCWIWTASVVTDGYGQFRAGGKGSRMVKAHRFAYEHFVGAVPDGLTLDHLCRVRRCCNPAHLEPVTQAENNHRSPVSIASINAAKIECKRGHPLSGANLRVNQAGRRVCVTCSRDAQRAWRDANRDRYRTYHREYQRERRQNEREARSVAAAD